MAVDASDGPDTPPQAPPTISRFNLATPVRVSREHGVVFYAGGQAVAVDEWWGDGRECDPEEATIAVIDVGDGVQIAYEIEMFDGVVH